MKKNVFYLFMLICSVCFFTACHDDDDDNDNKDYAKEIAAVYEGNMQITIGNGGGTSTSPQQITIQYAAFNKVNLELKNFAFGPITVGDVRIPDVIVTKGNNDNYKFSAPSSLNIPVVGTVTLQVDGIVKGKTLNFTINVNNVPTFETVDVNFVGTAIGK